MNTLWMAFLDEGIFHGAFPETARRRLDLAFSTETDSFFSQAVTAVGMRLPKETMIRWHCNVPYINHTAMVGMVSGGAIDVVKDGDGYHYRSRHGLRSIFALVRQTWLLTRYLNNPPKQENSIARSIGLGLVLQSLLLRVPADPEKLAAWLSSPEAAPRAYRKTIAEIQRVQVMRTHLSKDWGDYIGPVEGDPVDVPTYFWNDAPVNPSSQAVLKPSTLCAGEITGLLLPVTDNRDRNHILEIKAAQNAPVILVFRQARVQTTELFDLADGLVFCSGGTLAHACVVARERNIPSITQAGDPLFSLLRGRGPIWARLDAGACRIDFLEKQEAGR